MTALAYRVAPRSRKALRTIAEQWWAGLGVTGTMFPIVEVVDVALSKHFGDRYTFVILDKEQMGDSHGLTDPDQLIMLIREDVYDGANRGLGRDRFTLAHELAHLLLHGGRYLQRIDPNAVTHPTHQKFEDSEWQANAFASELLMPVSVVKRYSNSAERLATAAGASVQAAKVRIKVLTQEGTM